MITMSSERLRQQQREKEAFLAAEQEAAELPIKQEIGKQNRLLIEIRNTERAIACRELLKPNNPELAKRCTAYKPTGEQSPEEVYKLIAEAHKGSKLAIESRGYKLQDGYDRKVGQILQQNLNLDTRLQSTFDALFDYGVEIGFWSERELLAPEPVAEVPAEQQTRMDIEDVAVTGSRENESRARRLVSQQLFGESGEVKVIWNEFLEFCQREYNHAVTPDEQKRVIEYCTRRNLGWSHSSLDAARQDVLGLLQPSEILAKEVEKMSGPLDSFKNRTEFVRRTKELQ